MLTLGPLPAKGYASHGESWSFALALRLAAFELLRADGDDPVLILDDVFAELDDLRRARLADARRRDRAGARHGGGAATTCPTSWSTHRSTSATGRSRVPDDDVQPPPTRRTRLPMPSPSTTAAQAHDPTGLDLARALASGLRGSRRTTPTKHDPVAHARRAHELSGAHPDARDPALVGGESTSWSSDSGWETDLAVHGVFGRWDQIVGDEVAAHCVPESFAEGRLRSAPTRPPGRPSSGCWPRTSSRRLNEELGHGTVHA